MNRIFELFQSISEYVNPDNYQSELKLNSSGSGCFQLLPVVENIVPPDWIRQQYNQATWKTPEEGIFALEEILSKCSIQNSLKKNF